MKRLFLLLFIGIGIRDAAAEIGLELVREWSYTYTAPEVSTVSSGLSSTSADFGDNGAAITFIISGDAAGNREVVWFDELRTEIWRSGPIPGLSRVSLEGGHLLIRRGSTIEERTEHGLPLDVSHVVSRSEDGIEEHIAEAEIAQSSTIELGYFKETTGPNVHFTSGFAVSSKFSKSEDYVCHKVVPHSTTSATHTFQFYRIVGTEPEPAIVPDVTSGISGSNLIIRWQSQTGVRYQVQKSTDLELWEDEGVALDGIGATLQWASPVSAGDELFLRVVVEEE